METSSLSKDIFRHYIAIPQDHGSWVFLLSPLIIGLFAARAWDQATIFLVIAALAGFLIRQPVTIMVKILSGRRPRRELPAALCWIVIYGLIVLMCAGGLATLGYGYLLLLAAPGLPVFAWHLFLISRKAERRQLAVELAACGVLALAAPAALWVGLGHPAPLGWLLWALAWLQSAASIVYAYMRLEQRQQKSFPSLSQRLKENASLTRRAWLYSSFNTLAVILLSLARLTPTWLFLPYAVQLAETLWGSVYPATGARPSAIGMRQLAVSTLFTVLFILTWNSAR
jgi:hypothetical protein